MLNVLHTGLSGSSRMSVTGSPDKCTNFSSPQTSSDARMRVRVRVRDGPSRPVDRRVITTKHGSLVKDLLLASNNDAYTSRKPNVL
jgi:hypothetical protein